jgi:hypothetical protein
MMLAVDVTSSTARKDIAAWPAAPFGGPGPTGR